MRRLPGAIAAILLTTGLLSGSEEPPAPTPLFDGKSLAGWVAEQTDRFSVADGLLVSRPGDGWLRSAQVYKNFELELEFRILKEGSEGGLFFRAGAETGAAEPRWPVRGYQVPLGDGEGRLMLFGHATSPPRFERDADALNSVAKPPGEWRKLALRASGPRVEIRLDGALVTTADDVEPDAGHLGLYDKAGDHEWRNLTIRVQPD
ncbi:DUF1080 domain-containing protein [Paludisphaera sp.]|uniref:3-keto-disaccharide hydrolase n=1 Tax=Paludisphaera sp. TaxID=2017432 RepID=UPI00301C7D6E